jgi:hypothetical protein
MPHQIIEKRLERVIVKKGAKDSSTSNSELLWTRKGERKRRHSGGE